MLRFWGRNKIKNEVMKKIKCEKVDLKGWYCWNRDLEKRVLKQSDFWINRFFQHLTLER